MQYLTAYGALIPLGQLQADDFVIITAASSSVGLAAIQITKAEGARAIATTRTSKKRDELLSLGADHVIATQEESLEQEVGEITGGKGAHASSSTQSPAHSLKNWLPPPHPGAFSSCMGHFRWNLHPFRCGPP
jgi:NADPH:quinone reductase-like Zn-dependent oxidoreductase